MKISLRRALELAVGPANVDAAGHAVADWFDGRNCSGAADLIREHLQDQQGGDAVPHNRPDTSLRSELLAELASQQEVVSSLRERVERLERRWANETAGGDKLDRLIAQDKDADGPAVSEDREPASVVGEPSDELVAQWIAEVWHEGTPVRVSASDLHLASRAAEWGANWGRPAAPPAPLEREVPSLEEVEDLCEEHCFNVEGYESIECLQGLINDALARWAHQPAPPAEGEVEELVEWLRENAEEE